MVEQVDWKGEFEKLVVKEYQEAVTIFYSELYNKKDFSFVEIIITKINAPEESCTIRKNCNISMPPVISNFAENKTAEFACELLRKGPLLFVVTKVQDCPEVFCRHIIGKDGSNIREYQGRQGIQSASLNTIAYTLTVCGDRDAVALVIEDVLRIFEIRNKNNTRMERIEKDRKKSINNDKMSGKGLDFKKESNAQKESIAEKFYNDKHRSGKERDLKKESRR